MTLTIPGAPRSISMQPTTRSECQAVGVGGEGGGGGWGWGKGGRDGDDVMGENRNRVKWMSMMQKAPVAWRVCATCMQCVTTGAHGVEGKSSGESAVEEL